MRSSCPPGRPARVGRWVRRREVGGRGPVDHAVGVGQRPHGPRPDPEGAVPVPPPVARPPHPFRPARRGLQEGRAALFPRVG
eukprot:5374921-Lingulodinium_polyedra.AAC.1